jgi:hypothetical protein
MASWPRPVAIRLLDPPVTPVGCARLLSWPTGQLAGEPSRRTPALLTLPVTPAVRAALYRMLAGLPGVRSLGPVTDAGGRAGVAVALSGRYSGCGQESALHSGGGTEERPTFASCVVEQRLVIDPASGMPLAQELRYAGLPPGQHWSAPDGLFSFRLFRAAGWTGASPPES